MSGRSSCRAETRNADSSLRRTRRDYARNDSFFRRARCSVKCSCCVGLSSMKRLAEEMGSELLIARFLKKPNGFWHVSSDCQRATPPRRVNSQFQARLHEERAYLKRELPVQQEGVQTNGNSTEGNWHCQPHFTINSEGRGGLNSTFLCCLPRISNRLHRAAANPGDLSVG
jgi:hypothetical protein